MRAAKSELLIILGAGMFTGWMKFLLNTNGVKVLTSTALSSLFVTCLCDSDVNGLEFAVKTGDYKDIFRTSSVDMIDNLDEETDSCHMRTCFWLSLKLLLLLW